MSAPPTLCVLVFTHLLSLAVGYLSVSIDPLSPVVVGDTVALKCSFQTNGSLQEVMWFQVIKGGGTKQKIFTFNLLHNSSHRPMEDMSRVDLVYQSTVRLPEVQMEDDGLYECHVSIHDHESRDEVVLASDSVILTVIVPPTSISLEAVSSPAPFSRYKAQNFTLVCTVAGAKPAPVVYFKRDGELIDVLPKTRFSSSDGLQNEVTNLDRNQAGLWSSKVLSRGELDDTKLQKWVSASDQEGRLTWIGNEASDAHQQGHRGEFEPTPEPTPEVVHETVVSREFPHWVQSSDPLYYFQIWQQVARDGSVDVTATLTWSLNPPLDSEALFSCEVTHPALSMPMQTEVRLVAPRGPKLSTTPSKARVGDTVRIVVQGFQLGPSASEVFPEPMFTWTRVGGRLLDGTNHRDGRELVLERVPAELNGSMFRCTVQNPLGSTDTHIRLVVFENPRLKKGGRYHRVINAVDRQPPFSFTAVVLALTLTSELT